jgi:hypothetical protein
MFVKNFLKDLQLVCKLVDRVFIAPDQNRSAPKWTPPVPGLVKLNVDGSCSRNTTISSAAFVTRDHEGTYMGSSTMVLLGIIDPSTLEALACREALALVDDLM